VVEEEAAQHLVQSPVHLQPGRSSHQPLQQLLQLFGHVLRRNQREELGGIRKSKNTSSFFSVFILQISGTKFQKTATVSCCKIKAEDICFPPFIRSNNYSRLEKTVHFIIVYLTGHIVFKLIFSWLRSQDCLNCILMSFHDVFLFLVLYKIMLFNVIL